MTDDKEPVERRTVTMRPSNWLTVEAYAREVGDDSLSRALRRIVEEWAVLKGYATPQPSEGPSNGR